MRELLVYDLAHVGVAGQHDRDLVEGQPQLPQGGDLVQHGQVRARVEAMASGGPRRRHHQADLVVLSARTVSPVAVATSPIRQVRLSTAMSSASHLP